MIITVLASLFLPFAQVPQRPATSPTLAELRTRLNAYERRTAETGRVDPWQLADIARAVIEEARRSTTPSVWFEACGSSMIPESADCHTRLWAIVRADREPMTRRASAASALMARGDADIAKTLAGLLKTAPTSTLAPLVPIIANMPARDAVPLLVRLAESSTAGEQEQACEALSAFDVPESHAAVTKIVDGNPPGTPPWLYCMIARARLREPTPPGAVGGYGNTLQGRGRLFAARVLLDDGNDAGVQLLVDLTHRGDTRDRLTAADLLVSVRQDAAIPVIEAAETNTNPAIRAAALTSERRLKRSPSTTVRSMLVDADGTVRVRAAEIVIDWAKSSQNR